MTEQVETIDDDLWEECSDERWAEIIRSAKRCEEAFLSSPLYQDKKGNLDFWISFSLGMGNCYRDEIEASDRKAEEAGSNAE